MTWSGEIRCTIREAWVDENGENDGETDHCFHDLVGEEDLACCWCGDVFLKDKQPNWKQHGPELSERMVPK